jgi:hypothetical protein
MIDGLSKFCEIQDTLFVVDDITYLVSSFVYIALRSIKDGYQYSDNRYMCDKAVQRNILLIRKK